MLLCGLDFETTGLDTKLSHVVEVGLVLWDTDIRKPVKTAGFLVDPGQARWEPGAGAANGLTPELCNKYGMADNPALRQVLNHVGVSDAVVAHNGNLFDFPLLEFWAERHGLPIPEGKVRIDTMTDVENYPPKSGRKLSHLAADHGFLNPFPHRAMFDVLTTLTILDRYDINRVVEVAKSPTLLVEALVSFEKKDLAKQQGFYADYEGGRFRRWAKSVKELHLAAEREACREKMVPEVDEAGEPVLDDNGVQKQTLRPGFEIRIVKR
jgi:DNA polymerase-3 subunit epsilon